MKNAISGQEDIIRMDKRLFHYISYLQFPFFALGFYYALEPNIVGFEHALTSINSSMLFVGLAVGFSTLHNTNKKQNRLTRFLLSKPKYSKMYLIYILILIAIILSFGFFGLLISDNQKIIELSTGAVAIGIGTVGLLKMTIEILENQSDTFQVKSARNIFHRLSYLQYPLLIIAMYFAFKPNFNGLDYMFSHINEIVKDYNYFFIFSGIVIGFSTLQDTQRTSFNFEKSIWRNPKYGKMMITLLAVFILLELLFGMIGFFISKNENIQNLSTGAIVFAIGMIGLLKAATETYDNHREDKAVVVENE